MIHRFFQKKMLKLNEHTQILTGVMLDQGTDESALAHPRRPDDSDHDGRLVTGGNGSGDGGTELAVGQVLAALDADAPAARGDAAKGLGVEVLPLAVLGLADLKVLGPLLRHLTGVVTLVDLIHGGPDRR